MKILAICEEGANDIHSHGKVAKEGLAFLKGEFELLYAAAAPDDGMVGYDAVIVAGDKIGEGIEERFEKYLNCGGGIVFLHAGIVACNHSPFLKSVSGCTFVNHPEQCVVECAVTSPHPVAEGVTGFAETDEQYFIDVSATDTDVFLEGRSKNGNQPSGYTRIHSGGNRVCVLTPGHNLSVFENAQYKKIIRNAVLWVCLHPLKGEGDRRSGGGV